MLVGVGVMSYCPLWKGLMITGLGIHREVWLSLQDAVHHAGAVTIRGVVRIGGGQLDNRCSWGWGGKQGQRRTVRKDPVWSRCWTFCLLSCLRTYFLGVCPSETSTVNFSKVHRWHFGKQLFKWSYLYYYLYSYLNTSHIQTVALQ